MTQRPWKVMVVDDDLLVLEIATARLEDMGYEVVTHDRGLGTVHLLLQHKPDVLLLDVNLPLLTGPQLAEMIRGRVGETVVILHSARESDSLSDLVQQTGAAGAIHKTGNQHDFKEQFEQLVQPRLQARSKS